MSSMLPYGNIRGMISYSQSIDVASVAANTTAEQDFTLTGLLVGDIVTAIKPTLSAGLGIVGCRVKSANTLSITFINATASPIDPGAEKYRFLIRRPDNATDLSVIQF